MSKKRHSFLPTRFVLGASDPEMMMIERILTEQSIPFVPAQVYKGSKLRRANHAECYRTSMSDGIAFPKPQKGDVWIECEPVGGKQAILAEGGRFIDHHYPGDLGYLLPPSQHARASSIAQLCHLLSLPLTPERLLTSAIDHALAASYRNEISGITRDDVFFCQTELMIDEFQKTREQIESDINVERVLIRESLPRITVDGYSLVDYRERTIADSYDYLCVREAALYEGVAMILQRKFRVLFRERTGYMLVAHTPAPLIEKFLAREIFPELHDRFGVPQRSYAGGYLSDRKNKRS